MTDYLETNMKHLEDCQPHLVSLAKNEPADHVVPHRTTQGAWTLILQNSNGQISLHSRIDPVREAQSQVRGLEADDNDMVVILGLGLGYHLRAALDRLPESATLVVIEPDPSVFQAAVRLTGLTGLFDRPRFHLIVSSRPEEVLKEVTKLHAKHTPADVVLLDHPPSIRAHTEFFLALKTHLEPVLRHPMHKAFLYPKFKKDCLNILILNTGYHLTREAAKAARAGGHHVRFLDIPDTRRGRQQTIEQLLQMITGFRPDFILTINHLGFDVDGVLTGLLTRIKTPIASWFVDSPTLILKHSPENVSDYCAIFVWDSDYVDEVRSLGYHRVHYLPLATDETVFRPQNGRPGPLDHLSCRIGFVGDSMQKSVQDYTRRLNLAPDVLPLVDQAARAFSLSADRMPDRAMSDVGLTGHPSFRALSPQGRSDLAGLVIWRATQQYRLNLVRTLSPLTPTIVGDGGWNDYLDSGTYHYHPPLNYHTELPYFYPVCRININATSMQMKTGLNQRVFDVPACGSFLLTDDRSQLRQLFDVGRDVVAFGHPGEALDLARYYLGHERHRLEVVQNAHHKILDQHTYRHRLDTLIGACAGNLSMKPDSTATNRILVVQLARFGDFLQTTPLLAALKEEHPRAALSVLVDTPQSDLARSHPLVDEVLTVNLGNSTG